MWRDLALVHSAKTAPVSGMNYDLDPDARQVVIDREFILRKSRWKIATSERLLKEIDVWIAAAGTSG